MPGMQSRTTIGVRCCCPSPIANRHSRAWSAWRWITPPPKAWKRDLPPSLIHQSKIRCGGNPQKCKRFLQAENLLFGQSALFMKCLHCLLYTSDAADDLLCVDLGGRRIIK